MNDHLEAALAYAADGWKVFPLQPGRKDPLRGSRGFGDATTVKRTIRHWWGHHPEYNIGIATGYPGPDVLDIDVRNGKPGANSYHQLLQAGLIPQEICTHRTPSGGMHLLFPGTDQGCSATAHGVDFRSKGGYIVAPPSWSEADGARWELYSSRKGQPKPIDWKAIKNLLDPPGVRPVRSGSSGKIGGRQNAMACAVEGERNITLFKLACGAIEDGLDPYDLVAPALHAGLPDWEIDQTIHSARQRVRRA